MPVNSTPRLPLRKQARTAAPSKLLLSLLNQPKKPR